MTNQYSAIETPTSFKDNSSPVVRFFAHLFSYIFHPLFIPLYVTWFLAYMHPSYFTGFSSLDKKRVLIQVTVNTIFFPLITVLLLKGLGFIKSFYLRTQQDRIIPYIASGIYFFWMYLVCRNSETIPSILTEFILGVFLASSAALIFNIYFKISMHAIGMGGMIGLFLIIMLQNTMLMTWPLSVAFLIAGFVCTSRLIISDHSSKEIYVGLLVGLACQFFASIAVV